MNSQLFFNVPSNTQITQLRKQFSCCNVKCHISREVKILDMVYITEQTQRKISFKKKEITKVVAKIQPRFKRTKSGQFLFSI